MWRWGEVQVNPGKVVRRVPVVGGCEIHGISKTISNGVTNIAIPLLSQVLSENSEISEIPEIPEIPDIPETPETQNS